MAATRNAGGWSLRGWLRAVACCGLVLGTGQAQAVDLPTFNTGVDASGAPLAPGAADPHWQVVAGPNVTSAVPAFVVNNQSPFGLYAQTTDSRWIWVEADGRVSPGGPYTFRLQFDLTGIDTSNLELSGQWGIDDTGGTILLNGAAPEGTGLTLLPTSFDNFTSLHGFTITSGFAAGVNNLDFTASDVANPGGLNVSNLALVPEPTSLVLLSGGGLVLWLSRRKRRVA